MHFSRGYAYLGAAGVSALYLIASCALAGPLPRDAASANGEARTERPRTDADLALSDPRFDLLPETSPTGVQRQLAGVDASRRVLSGDAHSFDFGQAAHPAGGSVEDMLRSFVNIRRDTRAEPAGASARRSKPQDADPLGFDLGLASKEWIRESVQSVMTSVLNLNVDERGQASFSVLGLGDFSFIVSADRSEVALLSGDDVLVAAQRAAYPSPAGSGAQSAAHANEWIHGDSGTAAAGEVGHLSLLRQAIEIALEIASHPLSFIVYALIAGYALVWGVLSGLAKRPLRAAAGRRAARVHAIAHAAVNATPKRSRKRTRVRARKYR